MILAKPTSQTPPPRCGYSTARLLGLGRGLKKYSIINYKPSATLCAEWNGGLWFVWGCACLPGSSYKKPTSEIFSAARTPRRENRPPSWSELIWEEQVSLTASLLSSTTPASAAAVSTLAALTATLPGFLAFWCERWAVTAWSLGFGPGILPASLVSYVAVP